MENLLLPLLAAITQAASLLFHKVGLAKRKIPLNKYVPLLFFFLSVYTLTVFPVLGWVDTEILFSRRSFVFLGTILIVAIIWNYCYFTAIKSEKVNLIENIISLSPLTTIIVVWGFAPESFDGRIAAVAFVATLAMVWGYWHKHRIQLSHNALLLFLAVFFMSFENVLVGLLLQDQALSPVALFAIRTTVMCLFFSLYYRTDFEAIEKKNIVYIGLIAILGTAMMLLRFYGLRDSGIVYTSLVLILVPFLVFIASAFILHEKFRLKQAVTILIVLLCVLYAAVLQG